MVLLNSRQGHFSAAPSGSTFSITLPGRSFSRSYGAILPSSLTRVLPIALVYSTRLPVSVCGTGTRVSLEAFLGSMGSITCGPYGHRHHLSGSGSGFSYYPHFPTGLAPESNNRLTYPSASPHCVFIDSTWFRNINRMSIAYASRPRLRSD